MIRQPIPNVSLKEDDDDETELNIASKVQSTTTT
jgi:hypothetical protein